MPLGLRLTGHRTYCLSVRGSSDGPVGVEHNSKSTADPSGWEVFCEFSSNSAEVTVCLNNFAPDALEVGVVFSVLGSLDVGNALAKVEGSRFAVVKSLDFDKSLLFVLRSLSTLESHENCFLVESNIQGEFKPLTYLTGCPDFF